MSPNASADQLDCEQCGMCIDVCPVGALTSGSYRYKTRPWEMNHVSTVCTHCGDGCKVTLGVRQSNDGSEIVRADNRDKSGINGDFLCAKGRFGFDFVESPERLTKPLVRNAAGQARTRHLGACAAPCRHASSKRFATARGGAAIGVIGSNRTTNEENYLLQKFARTVLSTNNIDHERTTDYRSLCARSGRHTGKTASLREIGSAPAILLIGGDPTDEHPLLAWHLRTNVRLNRARLYIANRNPSSWSGRPRLRCDSARRLQRSLPPSSIREANRNFAKAVAGRGIADHHFRPGVSRQSRRRSSSPGASSASMFALPTSATTPILAARPTWDSSLTCCPATFPSPRPAPLPNTPTFPPHPAKRCSKCSTPAANGDLGALLVVGANPVAELGAKLRALKNTFVVVQDLFLTETAALADVVFPAASLYEKSGTVTNTFGDVQLVRKAADRAGRQTRL